MEDKQTGKFKKDLKKLLKKYPSLEKDLDTLRKYSIQLFHTDSERASARGIHLVTGIQMEKSNWKIYKVKKFACRSLKGSASNSGMRLVYAYNDKTKEVVYLELYYKQDKENMDYQRFSEFLKDEPF